MKYKLLREKASSWDKSWEAREAKTTKMAEAEIRGARKRARIRKALNRKIPPPNMPFLNLR